MRLPIVAAVLGLLLVVVGLTIHQLALVILGVALAVVLVAISAMRTTQTRLEDPIEDLSPESRILIRPLRHIYQEVEQAANEKDASNFMAKDALAECKHLLDQSAAALRTRDQLVKEKRGRYEAEKSIADLKARLASASTEDEKNSLQSALTARTQEIANYDTLNDSIAKIESSVKQAEAAMAEMRAGMVTASTAGLADAANDPMRDAIGRMRALSATMIEVQDLTQK